MRLSPSQRTLQKSSTLTPTRITKVMRRVKVKKKRTPTKYNSFKNTRYFVLTLQRMSLVLNPVDTLGYNGGYNFVICLMIPLIFNFFQTGCYYDKIRKFLILRKYKDQSWLNNLAFIFIILV